MCPVAYFVRGNFEFSLEAWIPLLVLYWDFVLPCFGGHRVAGIWRELGKVEVLDVRRPRLNVEEKQSRDE